jgi:FkbM family methyltransferase
LFRWYHTTLNYNNERNVSWIDKIRAYAVYACSSFTSNIGGFLKYRRIYQNYTSVLQHLFRNKYPISALLRRGNQIQLGNHFEASLVTFMEDIGCQDYEISDNKVTFYKTFQSNNKTKVELYQVTSEGEIIDIFFNKVYEFLPVQGNIVVDIGANIGDSCIYFALRGARKIIAIEPFPKNYDAAKKNIEVNGFTDKTFLKLSGCAAKRGHINVDPLYRSDHSSRLVDFGQGVKIPLVTLRDIIDENKVSEEMVVLKMDCEGCEYDIILFSDCDTLRSFSHIQIEYHNGYQNLKEKLENCGFDVSVTKPLLARSSIKGHRGTYYVGQLYATRRQEK